jgi:hypothetical protein
MIDQPDTMKNHHVNGTGNHYEGKQIPFSHIAKRIGNIFQRHKEKLGKVTDLSLQFKAGVQEIDSFIQQNTSVVCSKCRKKCCVNRHACYTCEDLVYIYALGLKTKEHGDKDESQPCYFISEGGCRLERAIRPSGCNWYFCDALYTRMEKTTGSAYADFDDSLQKLCSLWMELTEEFLSQFNALAGHEMHMADLRCSSYHRALDPE